MTHSSTSSSMDILYLHFKLLKAVLWSDGSGGWSGKVGNGEINILVQSLCKGLASKDTEGDEGSHCVLGINEVQLVST